MKKKVTYIPTLQEYMKKRKKERADFLEIKNCKDCDYFKNDLTCASGMTMSKSYQP